MNRWINRTANLFLMMLCPACLLRLIQDSFHLVVEPEVYWWLALLCVLLWAAVFLRRCFFPGFAAAVGVLWYLIRYSEEKLSMELLDILFAVRSCWTGGLWNESGGTAFHASAENHTLALLLIVFVVVVYLAMVLSSRSARIGQSLLLTIPIVALCLAVNKNPPALPLLGMCLFWLELIISGDSYRPDDAAGLTVLLTLGPCVAVLGVSLLFNRPSSYVPEDKALMLSQRLEQLSNTISSFWKNRPQVFQAAGSQSDALSGWDQGQDTLDLTRPYDFSARRHIVFRFRGSEDGSLYLRGRSLGSYTGGGWTKAEEQTGSQALNYTAYAVAAAAYTGSGTVLTCDFAIEGSRAYDTLYLPYFTVCNPTNDVSVPSGGLSAYGGQYVQLTGGSFGPLPENLQHEQYSSFVMDYYTRLPESTRDALTELARENGLNREDGSILANVVDYVCRDSIYDLGVAPYPDGDYALYFLQSARRGYCIHYATAACCLYRALGIPARMCEGFLVTACAGSETIVRAADAHAWVEVWLDDVGWIPVEATYARSSSESGIADTSQHESDASPGDGIMEQAANLESGNTDEQVETRLDGIGSGTQNTDNVAESAPISDNGDLKTDGGEESQPREDTQQTTDEKDRERNSTPEKHINRLWLIMSGAFAAVIFVAVGRYVLVRRRLRRWLSEPDRRCRAIYLYRQACRVLHFGGEMPEAILTAAEKASFSPHSIGEEELQRSLGALSELTDQTQCSLHPLRRLAFRYLLGL